MDIRTFAVAVQMHDTGYRIDMGIERMAKMADFEAKMCFGDEEDAMRDFELAASKLREARELFESGASDLMIGFSKLGTATGDEKGVLEGYARGFLY
jgi:hypothetical protein